MTKCLDLGLNPGSDPSRAMLKSQTNPGPGTEPGPNPVKCLIPGRGPTQNPQPHPIFGSGPGPNSKPGATPGPDPDSVLHGNRSDKCGQVMET